MRRNPRLFRLSATVAIGALLCNPIVATAQPAPPPLAASPAPADQNQADPPTRVGRIASKTGAVSFRTSADTQWSAASLNYPVTAGDAFWTEPAARTELEISASRVALAGQTEFDITALDDSGLQAAAPQGEAWFHLLNLAPNEVWSIQTPRGMVRLTQPGRYAMVAGTTEQPTLITVLEGAAELDGPGLSLKLAANQTATVTGSDPFEGSVGPAVRDAFVTGRLNAERPRSAAIPAQLTYMSGVEDLAGYGGWSQAPDYGDVWYPSVSPDWVPYRDGQWAYVAPWGWTWVDSSPWGFAPFHYGRWARIDGRWGWVPGDPSSGGRPIYAPALVTFLGGAALAGGLVAWVALGPHEAYHPWYHASPAYLGRLNATHGTDPAANGFVNRFAATSAPGTIVTGSRPIRGFARPVPQTEFATMRPVTGDPALRPGATTLGVTPAVARQLNLTPGGIRERTAPGPLVRPLENGAQPVLIGPGATRPTGLPEPRETPRPGEPRPPSVFRPEGIRPEGIRPEGIRPEGTVRPPMVPAPSARLPIVETPREVRPEPRFEPRPEGPRAPEFRREAPPRAEAPPPPPRVEPFRPPPPRAEPPRPPPSNPHEKRPGER
jgi:hypothetical protein